MMVKHSAFGIQHSGIVVLFFAVLLAANPCYAGGRKGDMFKDQGIDTSDRPSVPSDAERGSDLFKPVPPMTGPGDAFSNTRPGYDFGRQDMFSKLPPEQPPDKLYDYPPEKR